MMDVAYSMRYCTQTMLETMREECERRILEMKREEKRGML
jgi:hypothetical protein